MLCGNIAVVCLVAAGLFVLPGFVGAQTPDVSGFERIDKVEEVAPVTEPPRDLPLDQAVRNTSAGLRGLLADWRARHLMSYLMAVSLATGAMIGLVTAVVAHRTAARHAKWSELRKKASGLSTASGAGFGVFFVTVMLPVPEHGKLTQLVLAMFCCALAAAVVCPASLALIRKMKMDRAAKRGLRIDGERLWIG